MAEEKVDPKRCRIEIVTFDKKLFAELCSLRFLQAHRHVVILGPVGVGKTFGEAFVKSQLGAGIKLPKSGKVFLSVKASDKPRAVKVARDLVDMGFLELAQPLADRFR